MLTEQRKHRILFRAWEWAHQTADSELVGRQIVVFQHTEVQEARPYPT